MRTRFLPKLINQEVEDYLNRNDLIFVPVGVVEMHGGFPLDCETVVAEAFALKLAEASDGLVLNNLPYFYAGATAMGRGTVQVSIRTGIDYLYAIAKALLEKGFKRQVYVSFHGPAEMTIKPVVRDFFDETKIPILYIELEKFVMSNTKLEELMEQMNNIFIGAYDVLGRLEDIPLSSTLEHDHSQMVESHTDFAFQMAYLPGKFGYYFEKKTDHGPTPRIDTVEERQFRADKGKNTIAEIVSKVEISKVVDRMRELEKFQREAVISKYGDWLPRTK